MELPDRDLAEASHDELAALLEQVSEERETVAAQQDHLILSARAAGMPQAVIARHVRLTQAAISKIEARSRGLIDSPEARVGRLLAVTDVIGTRAQQVTGRSKSANLTAKLFKAFRLTPIDASKLATVMQADLGALDKPERDRLFEAWKQARDAVGDPPGAIFTSKCRQDMIFGYAQQHRALTD